MFKKKILSLLLITILIISSFGISNINASNSPNAIPGQAHFSTYVFETSWTQWKFKQLNYEGNGNVIASNTWSQCPGWSALKKEPSSIDFEYRVVTQILLITIPLPFVYKWKFKVKMLHYTGGRIFVHTYYSADNIEICQIEYNGKMGSIMYADPKNWQIVDLQNIR